MVKNTGAEKACLGSAHEWEHRIATVTARCLVVSAVVAIVIACAPNAPAPREEGEMALHVSSAAFPDGASVPRKYTCDGQNVSPPLAWNGAPPGTQTFALVLDDPDAPRGVFTHWILFDLPAATNQLPEAIPPDEQLTDAARQGKNDFGRVGYGGPCPPPGPAHRYHFTLYALDSPLNLPPGASKKQLLDAMQRHILAQGELMATYHR